MSRNVKRGILLIALAQIILALGLLALPRFVQALPGEYRVRLARVPAMEPILSLGETPMPTALPAPTRPAADRRVTIPLLTEPTATPTATPLATAAAAASSPEPPPASPTATTNPTATATPKPLPRQARIEGLEIIPCSSA